MDSNKITYIVAAGTSEFQIKIKGSKFVGYCTPAIDEDAAKSAIDLRSREHHNATHNCWAYRVGDHVEMIERCADMGEPSGTAGRPILEQINRVGLLNVVVVVTRWFGGTKLGRGGLIRAYGDCAAGCLELVKIKEIRPIRRLVISCEYTFIGLIEKLLDRWDGRVQHGIYEEQVQLTCEVPLDCVDRFRNALIEASAGKVDISEG